MNSILSTGENSTAPEQPKEPRAVRLDRWPTTSSVTAGRPPSQRDNPPPALGVAQQKLGEQRFTRALPRVRGRMKIAPEVRTAMGSGWEDWRTPAGPSLSTGKLAQQLADAMQLNGRVSRGQLLNSCRPRSYSHTHNQCRRLRTRYADIRRTGERAKAAWEGLALVANQKAGGHSVVVQKKLRIWDGTLQNCV